MYLWSAYAFVVSSHVFAANLLRCQWHRACWYDVACDKVWSACTAQYCESILALRANICSFSDAISAAMGESLPTYKDMVEAQTATF